MRGKPRVMTLDEVITADFVHLEFQGVIWEDCAVLIYPVKPDVQLIDPENRSMYLSRESYNDSWRCWTAVPTPEQQEAKAWKI